MVTSRLSTLFSQLSEREGAAASCLESTLRMKLTTMPLIAHKDDKGSIRSFDSFE